MNVVISNRYVKMKPHFYTQTHAVNFRLQHERNLLDHSFHTYSFLEHRYFFIPRVLYSIFFKQERNQLQRQKKRSFPEYKTKSNKNFISNNREKKEPTPNI